MESQLTVRLPRHLADALKIRAGQMQRKPSELVRMAVSEFLQIPEQGRAQPAERVKDLIGSLQSGVQDLAVRHREHILKKLRRGR